jgi:hypothetical protein
MPVTSGFLYRYPRACAVDASRVCGEAKRYSEILDAPQDEETTSLSKPVFVACSATCGPQVLGLARTHLADCLLRLRGFGR